MPELDDHTTDALFQEGADKHDFSYEPAAWEQMVALLENEERARRRRFAWLIRLGLLLLLALGAVGFHQWGAGTKQEVTSVTKTGDSPAVPASGKNLPPAGTRVADPAPDKKTPPVAAADTLVANQPAFPLTGVSTELNGMSSSAATGQSPGVSQKTTTVLPEDNKPAGIIEDNGPGRSAISDVTVPIEAGRSAPVPADSSTFATLHQLPLLPLLPLSFVPQATGWPEGVIRPVVVQEGNLTRRPLLSLGLTAGVVFSAVKTPELGEATSRFGAKVSYHLSDHFAIGTGAYLTKSWYEAAGADYQIKEEDFWTYDIQPESVRAKCAILDVPLSLTYFPRGSNRAGPYVGAGLSSYFMLRENYYYEYEIPNNDFVQMWMENNANRHLMGVGLFNLGYQRPYGKRSALQVESFIHLPLAGIGHGQVRLVTVGATVNYAFGINRKK